MIPSFRMGLYAHTFPVTPQTPGVLDAYTTGLYILGGLTRYLSAYTGPLIRVIRSSDSAQLDIGYLPDNTLDVVSLMAFAGSSDVFIIKGYDQSGNGSHMAPQAGSNGPRIVHAGVMDTMPEWNITGTATTFICANKTVAGTAHQSWLTKSRYRDYSGYYPLWFTGNLNAGTGHNGLGWQYQPDSDHMIVYYFSGPSSGGYNEARYNKTSTGTVANHMVTIDTTTNPVGLEAYVNGTNAITSHNNQHAGLAASAEDIYLGMDTPPVTELSHCSISMWAMWNVTHNSTTAAAISALI
jgi:hypothetical protein